MEDLYEKSLEMVKEIRVEWARLDTLRDEGLKLPKDVVRYENIPYGPGGEEHLTDIYCKKGSSCLLPVIVSVHGGGWVYSNKEFYKFYCLSLADRGFAVVNFNYRLAPEHPYPAAVEDINRLFGWLLNQKEAYGLDTDNIFVVGDSAGAQMAAQYLAMLTNKEYGSLFEFSLPEGLKIRGAALNCGIYDLEYQDDTIRLLLPAYFGGNQDAYKDQTDIFGHLTRDFPPTYVMTAYHDFLKECAEPFYRALKELGVACVLREYGSADRPEVEHVFHCDLKLPEAAVCNDEECEFFKGLINRDH